MLMATTAGAVSFIILGHIILTQSNLGASESFNRGTLAWILLTSSLLYVGLFHFLQTKKKKELLWLVSAVAATLLLGGIAWIAKLYILVPILSAMFSAFFLYKYVPLLPRKKYIYVALGANCLSIILYGIYTISLGPVLESIIWGSNLLFNFMILLIFFHRIADLIQAASHQSITDGLTKLYYKTFFISKVREAMINNPNPAVIFADIDDFKKLNDTEGHFVGDKILALIGSIWNDICTLDVGLAARYGGEETVALITSPLADANRIAERFRARVEEESKSIYPVTVSVGIAYYKHDVESAEEFIKQADEAMYDAKYSGKNQVVAYNSGEPKPEVQAKNEVSVSVPETTIECNNTESVTTESILEPPSEDRKYDFEEGEVQVQITEESEHDNQQITEEEHIDEPEDIEERKQSDIEDSYLQGKVQFEYDQQPTNLDSAQKEPDKKENNIFKDLAKKI